MSEYIKNIFKPITGFLSSPIKRRLLFLIILTAAAVVEFFILGLARRTFVFYNVDNGVTVVEDRMLKYSKLREEDIVRYTEETLLGPVSQDLMPLFPRDTKLKSLLYRNKAVYIDFTESAALPPQVNKKNGQWGDVLDNFRTFSKGILRNFPYVKDVRFFIEGNAVFQGSPDEFIHIQEEFTGAQVNDTGDAGIKGFFKIKEFFEKF